jgi:hypothetical protein
MDIAAFVGFAAAGPVDVPVAVEDAGQFAAVFGEDAELAWDPERGELATAQLAPAVRAFFRNGGHRAWVVRVAGPGAERSRLPIAGLLESVHDGEPRAAALWSRARGSWADGLRVGAALISVPAVLRSADAASLEFRVEAGPNRPVAGDLLRLVAGRLTLLVAARAVSPAGAAAPGRTVFAVSGDPATALWLEEADPPAGTSGTAYWVDAVGHERSAAATVSLPEESPPAVGARLDLHTEAAHAPVQGTLVRWVEALSPPAARTLWLRVARIGEGDRGTVRVGGRPVWALHGPPSPPPGLPAGDTTVERLGLELRVRREGDRFVLTGLGLVPGHPRYVGDLPTDEELFTPRDPLLGPDPPLWTEAATPRFPLAGALSSGTAGPVYYPLAVDVLPQVELGPLHLPGTALERDGLEVFSASLFLDHDLRGVGPAALVDEAGSIRWQRPVPRRLTGIHALLELEEATLVAAPDALQRGWSRLQEQSPPAPPSIESPPSPPEPPEEFVACELRDLEHAPELTLVPRDQGGSFGLDWTSVDEPGVRYVLQEGTDPLTWRGARTIHAGPEQSLRLYGRTSGTHFYRVRAEAGPNVSAWSNGVAVGPPAGPGYAVTGQQDYRPDALLAVQRALLRLCDARGDALAVLSVPEHYNGDAAIAHVEQLRWEADALGFLEDRTLGFGALYHPWLVLSVPERGEALCSVGPDGCAAGVIARRAASRGAWVAPANEPFADVVGLARPEPREALGALQDAQVNELREEPGGFMCLCEDTLSRDADVRPINVRRLLALVRRLVLRDGAEYVFEPNDPVFRRDIERGFGDVMQTLYMLGAFAGRSPEQAYRVGVGDPPNTPMSIDRGRLIVELKLAPSRPLAFLLVRLIHAGERGLRVETP